MIAALGLPVEQVTKRLNEGHPNVVDVINDGSVVCVINTPEGRYTGTLRDGFHIRRAATEKRIPCFTSIDTARAAVDALVAAMQQRRRAGVPGPAASRVPRRDRGVTVADAPAPSRITELLALFGKLGVVGFGGPTAHIALMDDEVVTRRAWLPRDEFVEALAATNIIPGPNSTEMAIHVGHRRAGTPARSSPVFRSSRLPS